MNSYGIGIHSRILVILWKKPKIFEKEILTLFWNPYDVEIKSFFAFDRISCRILKELRKDIFYMLKYLWNSIETILQNHLSLSVNIQETILENLFWKKFMRIFFKSKCSLL